MASAYICDRCGKIITRYIDRHLFSIESSKTTQYVDLCQTCYDKFVNVFLKPLTDNPTK